MRTHVVKIKNLWCSASVKYGPSFFKATHQKADWYSEITWIVLLSTRLLLDWEKQFCSDKWWYLIWYFFSSRMCVLSPSRSGGFCPLLLQVEGKSPELWWAAFSIYYPNLQWWWKIHFLIVSWKLTTFENKSTKRLPKMQIFVFVEGEV